ncbi:hypothetical protein EGW08_022190, partial [Elysia chlorotica]
IGFSRAVGSPLTVLDRDAICRKTRRLAGRQRRICRDEPEIVHQVAQGAKLALQECQWQFQSRKWNCSTAKRSLSRILRRTCSMGELLQCSCDHNKRDFRSDGEWEWGGCGDDVDYGYRKSREFMDARKRKRRGDFTTKLQLHNNKAGRVAVRDYMRRVCKCHGLSGSCALKTCWKKMPTFREVGDRLKAQFDGAIRVI